MRRLFPFAKIVSVGLVLTASVIAQNPNKQTAARRNNKEAPHATREPAPAADSQETKLKYVPIEKYDPLRNAEQDIKDAVAEARRTGKRVLLEVGGEWCIWCHILDGFFEKNKALLSLRLENFITLKINFSEENKNEQVLSRYPAINGYPHLFVLDVDGKLLHSQDTGHLEQGRTYNLEKFMSFLKEWSPDKREDPGAMNSNVEHPVRAGEIIRPERDLLYKYSRNHWMREIGVIVSQSRRNLP